jgi:hypothetical protein
VHILPFAGDEVPPSQTTTSSPSTTSTTSSTLTLTRLLHGAVTAKRHALSDANTKTAPSLLVPWEEDEAVEEDGGSHVTFYCPCFGGRVCPREGCEWRETVGGASSSVVKNKGRAIREEMVRRMIRIINVNDADPYSHTPTHNPAPEPPLPLTGAR